MQFEIEEARGQLIVDNYEYLKIVFDKIKYENSSLQNGFSVSF